MDREWCFDAVSLQPIQFGWPNAFACICQRYLVQTRSHNHITTIQISTNEIFSQPQQLSSQCTVSYPLVYLRCLWFFYKLILMSPTNLFSRMAWRPLTIPLRLLSFIHFVEIEWAWSLTPFFQVISTGLSIVTCSVAILYDSTPVLWD